MVEKRRKTQRYNCTITW